MKIDLTCNFDVTVFGQRFRPTQPLFKAWLTTYSANVVLLGRQFQVPRPGAKQRVAEKLQKESPLSVCLSALYERQGWLKELRERAAMGWGAGDVAARVPPPHRHGGKGRGAFGYTLNPEEEAFYDGISFEFGGDAKPTPKEA